MFHVKINEKGFLCKSKVIKKNLKDDWFMRKKVLKVWDRASQIVPDMVGFTLAVHNWKQFVTVYITEDMLWHRLWEFSFTRTFRGHPF